MCDQPVNQSVSGDNNIFTATGDVYIYKSPPALTPEEAKEKRELNILLRRVKQFWIEGVLEKSVVKIALIDLGKETQAQAVAHAWEQVLELPDQTRQTIPPNKKIGRIFEELNRSLLILGEPGSGKTITLLQLASELLEVAENDENYSQPIPVIFNLSTWTSKQPSMFDWMVAELSSKYQIPKTNSRKWLKDNRILPLLDGLDEVDPDSRTACVEAIDKFVEEYGLSGLAVCSRLKEYTDLRMRLRLNGAIRLLPLSLEQIYEALDSAGEKLDGIKRVLHVDENLQTLASSPLFFGILLLTYQEQTTEKGGLLENIQDPLAVRRHRLFNTYIDFMLKRKREGGKPYNDQQVRDWLTWLARQMLHRRQTIFLIEQMQPDWLLSRFQQVIYLLMSRLMEGAIIGLIVGIVIGLNAGLVSGILGGVTVGLINVYRTNKAEALKESGTNKLLSFATSILTVSLIVWFVIWLFDALRGYYFEGFLFGLVFGVVFGITFGLGDRPQLLQRDVRTVEALSWHWGTAFAHGRLGLIAGFFFGLGAELVYRVSFGVSIISHLDWWLGTSILVGTAAGISGWIYGGLQTSVIEVKTLPNQGIRLSLRNGAFAGLITGVVMGTLGGLLGDYYGNLLYALSGGVIASLGGGLIGGIKSALAGGLIVAFWYGWFDVLKHYTLRPLVYLQGSIPLFVSRFLDFTVDRVFLQKVGGGYIFIHRLLMEHFAQMDNEKSGPS